jgi:hypothetical protein
MPARSDAYGLVGFAVRKGAAVAGAGACERFLRRAAGLREARAGKGGKAGGRAPGGGAILLVAGDAARNTAGKFTHLAELAGVAWRQFGERQALGRYAGREMTSVLIVTDPQLGAAIMKTTDGAVEG